MHPRRKKILVVVGKVVVLAVLGEYARRHAQVDDEIAVLAAAPDQPPVGTRLVVLRAPSESVRGYLTRTPQGRLIEVAESDVDTGRAPDPSSNAAVGEAPHFALLPGLRTLLSTLRWGHLAAAYAAFGPALFLMAVRWQVLLRANAIRIPFLTVVRLHYLGFFYNAFMPGSAGGDIIKAVYLARQCEQKTEAATVVLVDRVVGLIGLLAVAGAVVLIDTGGAGGLARQIGSFAFALVLGSGLYFSARFRELVHYDRWVSRLPRADLFMRIDAALYGLRQRKKALAVAFGLTLVLQLIEIVGVSWGGDSLGLHRARFAHYLVFVPLGFLVNSLPISFGGMGLMEGAYMKLFHDAGVATATQGFMLGVLTRLIILAWSALGAVSALFPPSAALAPATLEVA
jgi:uncharacterized protein (TIRG00374 family)